MKESIEQTIQNLKNPGELISILIEMSSEAARNFLMVRQELPAVFAAGMNCPKKFGYKAIV